MSTQNFDPIDPKDRELEGEVITYAGQEKFRKGLDRIAPHFQPFVKKANERITRSQLKIVTLAGTNGKGQCAYQLTELLQAEGLKVATWTSPHLLSIRERIRRNGEMISSAEFKQRLDAIKRQQLPLSFYESVFWIFCHYVFETYLDEIDVVILEVGLGGRLDAVNLFDAQIVGIPSIGRDHQEFLGESLSEILAEKWGVVREGQVVLTTLTQRHLHNQMQTLLPRPKTHIDLIEQGRVDPQWSYVTRNLYLVATLKQYIVNARLDAPPPEGWEKLQKNPPLAGPGRGEQMTRCGTRFIFIGAHNLDGFRQMIDSLVKTDDGRAIDQIIVSFSKRRDKEIESCLRGLVMAKCMGSEIVVMAFDHPRAAGRDQLSAIVSQIKASEKEFSQRELSFDPNWSKDSLKKHLTDQQTVLVTGSYYFIAELQRLLLL